MSQLISSLYLEHKGLKKLLSLLQQKSDNLAQEKPIDFNLIEDVVMYIENFVDSYHHPKEDVIYQYIIDNNLDDSNEFQTKLNDHDDIKELTQHLKQVLHSISLDVIVSKESLNSQLKNFIY